MFAADCPIFKHRLIVNVFAYLTEVTHPYKLKRSHLQLILFKLPETKNRCSLPLGAAESERILAGEGCAMFERSEFAPAAKIRVDEGSLRSKPATGVTFLCLLSLVKQRK